MSDDETMDGRINQVSLLQIWVEEPLILALISW